MELKVQNLSKSYGDKQVLKDISFTFESGKIYGLIGRNGAGKTTFFDSLNGNFLLDSGMFFLDSNVLTKDNIGYVISEAIVPEFLTAKEFLTFFLQIHQKEVNEKILSEYFSMVQISLQDQNKLLKEYSKGMKNKIQILINMVNQPDVLLLDEPLTSLDVVVQEDMKKLLKSYKKDHIVILSTHILELALDLCDRILILNNMTLEEVEKKNLNTKKYKDKIIQMLRDEKND